MKELLLYYNKLYKMKNLLLTSLRSLLRSEHIFLVSGLAILSACDGLYPNSCSKPSS